MPDRQLEELISLAAQDARKLIEAAYEAGRADMRRELFVILSDNKQPPEIAVTDSDDEMRVVRAPSGTVKPQIKAMIANADNGIKVSEIIEKTGFKDSSVRGTLSALKAEGFAERRGELWVLSQRKGPLAEASEP
jgi:IclR helix-turn-helix domain